ncbi:MAG TPA: GWxTD domain-containing protein [Thermoanaerobaculia bacterium]|nr:GWxTD domain-containing protein [Thermoanaerobaculia bacterium]
MKTLSLCSAVAIVVSTSALAQVTPKYMGWADGPVRHLMTKEEMKQWKVIRSDQDAEAFIALFWAKRDPTSDTRRNEFREDFQQRVKFADRNFSNGLQPGSMTDRGKVIILLGPPYRVSGSAGAPSRSTGLGPTVDAQGHLVVARPTSDPTQQFWMYAHERKPKFIAQTDFTMVFLEEGKDDWKLAHTERVNPDLILQQAAIAFIISPGLTKPPVYTNPPRVRTTLFKNPALKTAYEQFRYGDKPTIGNANLTWGEFVTSEGDHFVSAQVYMPAGNGVAPDQKVTSFAVVENKAGEIVDVKEDEMTMIASGGDAYLDRSLQLDPGTYTTTFGIASEGRILAATRTPMTIQGFDPAATGVSPLLLASKVYPLQTTWQPTDPFTFGGLKVVPKGDAVFNTVGDLWYFVEMRNPGVTDVGTPNVRVKIEIKGRTSTGPVELKIPIQDAKLAKLAGETNRYGLGLAIPLEGFKPGEYTMKVHLVDVVLGKEYDFEKPFRVRG